MIDNNLIKFELIDDQPIIKVNLVEDTRNTTNNRLQ